MPTTGYGSGGPGYPQMQQPSGYPQAQPQGAPAGYPTQPGLENYYSYYFTANLKITIA